MKKILFVASLLFIALQMQAQKFTIDLDSISENKVFVKDFKWKNAKDTVLVLTVKVNGDFYTNSDTSDFNFNVTFEGKLDSAKGFKSIERKIRKDKEDLIRREEARILRLYENNKGVEPKLREKQQAGKQGVIGDVPKSYNDIETPSKKRKWYQRKKK